MYSLTCEDTKAHIKIHRVYGANPVNEKMEIYQGSLTAGTKIHTETGKNSAFVENIIELCLVRTSHTILLTDAYVFR